MMKNNNILITICARGGSKGIPGKNIIEVNGKPLIAYTIEAATHLKERLSGCRVDIELSTDSEQIRTCASEFGLRSDYQRPAYLANDTCGKIDAIRHLVFHSEKKNNCKYDFIVDLDVTSPIRTTDDIVNCLNMFEKDKDLKTVFSVSPCARNPYFNQVEEKKDGYCKLVIEGKYLSRQAAPKVYDMNASIYVYRRSFFDTDTSTALTDKTKCYLMDHICFDLDEPHDYDYLSFLLSTKRIEL
jgi:CMP-N-acetylneuraminic acid synthetase